MPRYHIQETVEDTNGDPLDAATVTVCVLGTTEKSRVTLYADSSSATTLANPLTSDGSGLVDFYLAYPLVCDLVPVKAGVAGRTVTVRPGLPTVGDVQTWDGEEGEWQAPSGGGTPAVLASTVTVSSAEMLALHTTAKTLIAAPGSGLAIFPMGYIQEYLPGATPYGGASSSATFDVGWSGVLAEPSYFFQAFQDLLSTANVAVANIFPYNDDPALGANAPLQVKLSSGAVTGGNGTVRITVVYHVQAVG